MYRILILGLSCLLIGCKPAEPPFSEVDILAEFVGHWELLNSNSAELTQLIVLKKESGRVSVQLWGECLPGICEWNTRYFHEAELAQGPLSMTWTGIDLRISQTLTLLESGKMSLESVEDHADDRFDTVKTFLFTKNEKLKLFDQVSREEALRANLSREKLAGSPNLKNQLLPNSILLFQTTAGRYGKMQIRGNSAILTFRWKSWNEDGSVYREADYVETRANGYYDLNVGKEIRETDNCISDFLMDEPSASERWLSPQCGAIFSLYHVGT